MDTQTKVLLLVFAGLVLAYLLYNGNSEGFASEEAHKTMNMEEAINPHNDNRSIGNTSIDVNSNGSSVSIPEEEMVKFFPPNDYAPPESDWLNKKFNGRNKAAPGEYKRSSYSASKRGALGPSDWNDYFDHNNNVIGNSQTGDNDKFMPMDESNDGFAVFKSSGQNSCGSNQNCEPNDLFDVDKYLPQEVNDDFFEVLPEPISVKNRHLINITKPIGLNTVGASQKIANHDFRGAPACPKFVVSPFLNSSVEPDINLKPLM